MLIEIFEILGLTGVAAVVLEGAALVLGIWKVYDIANSFKK